MISAFDHPWLGGLFADPDISRAWSAEAQIAHWLAFEAALARALEATGRVGPGVGKRAADSILAQRPDLEGLAEGTRRDGVPVPRLVAELRAAAGPDAAAVHAGATSQDVLDTALSLTLVDVTGTILERLAALDGALAGLELRFGSAPLMARTRMQAALPVRAGDRIATWRAPLQGHARRLDALRPEVGRLQLAGPVGTAADWGGDARAIAERVAADLGLTVSDRSWHTDRSALADYAGALSLMSGSLGKLGQDICLMSQQGIDEIALAGGGGSSAMAHKNNPVLAELLVTLARFNAAQLAAMHGALVHEQERSGAAWMLEWMVLPSMTAATARGLSAAADLAAMVTRIGSPT